MNRHQIPFNPHSIHVGCIGGGQLGRMMALEAPRLNLTMSFLDPSGMSSPAGQVCGIQSMVVKGSLTDESKIGELVSHIRPSSTLSLKENNCIGGYLLTCEIEHINTQVLLQLEEDGVSVQPSSRVIGIIQDKLIQKQHFQSYNIPLPPFRNIPNIASLHEAAQVLGLPLMLKSRRGGYDGRGNIVLKTIDDSNINQAMMGLGIDVATDLQEQQLDVYAEGWIDFDCEVAVIVVRSVTGEIRAYPTVTTVQTNNICRVVLAPARNVDPILCAKCQDIAIRAVNSLGKGATGVFGVELFLAQNKKDGGVIILLNEVAPRPHNTGHYTQDACAVSQFENHLRAITGLPLGSTQMCVTAAAMVNILGKESFMIEDTMKGINAALSITRTTVHWYGKKGVRPGRKVGHINLTADSHGELDKSLSKVLTLEGILVKECNIPGGLFTSPLVGIIMGSQSDLPTMHAAVDILEKFDIPYEVDIVSAHRTPEKLVHYSRTASTRGLQVIIAGAGGAAHLPGMVASMSPLPVIGVPIRTSTLNGKDSLYSIVQMPRGIPVATVAIGNALNAGLLAIRCLCGSRPELRLKMEKYQHELKELVEDMSQRLLDQGTQKFLDNMENKNDLVNV